MQIQPVIRASLIALLLFGTTACDEGPAVLGDGGFVDSLAGTKCAAINLTDACQCGSAAGARSCLADGWGACQCADVPETLAEAGADAATGLDGPAVTPPGNLRTDITFDWERTVPTDASCEPGYYEGTFWGLYASGLTFVGAPIPVAALGTPLRPGLAFTLKESGDGEKLEITDGFVEGTADGLFPFSGTLTGTLDCKTLKFNAVLDGYYSLGVDGVGMFRFKGPVVADYNMNSHSMENGTWDVDEYDPPSPASAAGTAGGWGEWDAVWSP